jgi:hypothetical protein
MTEAETERAAIVAYLRETAATLDTLKDVRGEKVRSRYHAHACRVAADHIEWGQHHYPKEEAA